MKKLITVLMAAVSLNAMTPAMAYNGTSLAYDAAQTAPRPTNVGRPPIFGGIIKSLAVAFTNVGAAIITNRIIQAGTAGKNIGWGVGIVAAAVTDTALGTESAPTTAGGRTVGTETRTTGTVTNDQYTVTGTVTAGSTLAITEAGLFDAVTTGVLLIRSNFTAINVVSGDSIAFTFNLRFVPSAA